MTRCETCQRRIFYRRRGRHGIAHTGKGRGDRDHCLCDRCWRSATARLFMVYRPTLDLTTQQAQCQPQP